MGTWNEMLKQEFALRKDDFNKMVTTLSGKELNKVFDTGFGGEEGKPFTAWGEKYVYFPICYDGAEWVGSAPRNICDEKTQHLGGG